MYRVKKLQTSQIMYRVKKLQTSQIMYRVKKTTNFSNHVSCKKNYKLLKSCIV